MQFVYTGSMIAAMSLVHCAASLAAEPEVPALPSPQCLRLSEFASEFGPQPGQRDEPEYYVELAAITAACLPYSLYKVEGVCADGRRLLVDGNGYTTSIKLYTAEGQFQGLMWQSDAQSEPCWGQGAWPAYNYCEAPRIMQRICGFPIPPGTPAFIDRWAE